MKQKGVTVEFNGRQVSFLELARQTGISYDCLRDRYARGQRGAELVRRTGARRNAAPDVPVSGWIAEAQERQTKIETERAAHERRQQRLKRRAELLAARRAEHAAAFARPLIDASLLTPAERKAIHAAARGHQHWRNALAL